jgi:glycosyltransferase involved in cell wall biosynthesis
MASASQPFVSVVTPAYNGEKHLGECIASILAQTYENWEYIILNNCSTDRTLEIAESYAEKDKRIRICSNPELLPIIQNWNHAVRQISTTSKYCKIVHADDKIFPECVEKMVLVAETNPTVGIVGSYGLKGNKVMSSGMPFPRECISGRELCRLALPQKVRPFPRPTALLIRSDLIRERDPFYNESNLQADHEVCYEILRNHDFGFVYQVLTYMRVHNESVTSSDYAVYGKLHYTNLALLKKYGPVFLAQEEYEELLNRKLGLYYHFLAFSLFNRKDKKFWHYQRDSLHDLGYRLEKLKLYQIVFLELLRNPRSTFSKIKGSISSSHKKRITR